MCDVCVCAQHVCMSVHVCAYVLCTCVCTCIYVCLCVWYALTCMCVHVCACALTHESMIPGGRCGALEDMRRPLWSRLAFPVLSVPGRMLGQACTAGTLPTAHFLVLAAFFIVCQ